MPDLASLLTPNSESKTLIHLPKSPKSLSEFDSNTPILYPCPIKTLNFDDPSLVYNFENELLGEGCSSGNGFMKIEVTRVSDCGDKKKGFGVKGLEEYVKEWRERKSAFGVKENRCVLPFLVGAPKSLECRVCWKPIPHGDQVSCSVRGCPSVYHLTCVKKHDNFTSKKFKCPQHACFLCKQKFFWRCVRCGLASHDKCAAWPDKVIHLTERPGWAICWKHPKDWQKNKHAVSANNIEEVFHRLPLPYVEEEFNIVPTLKECTIDKLEVPSYVHIRRNVYLVKRRRDDAYVNSGCTSCSSICAEDCVCRVQCISCSRTCHCSEVCTNRPFRKEKKIRVVQTELCGWGVETAEPINKGEFVIEYIGEVIDDALCEQRLWDMKYQGVKNFYMCEVRKDFTIDATFKGNVSRFLNHSCDPNCKLEKWQVEGETRVGVFAARSIKAGEPLTYDYRFVQFGPEVKCHCGASNCQGYLGAKRKIRLDIIESKRKIGLASIRWGSKRKRSSRSRLAILSS